MLCGEVCGVGADVAINLRGAFVSGDLGGLVGTRLPPIRLASCRFENGVDFIEAIFTGDASFDKATFDRAARFDRTTFPGDARF